MFNLKLKCLTRKFYRQTLSEVKPAPLSETVDHTIPTSYLKPTSPVPTTTPTTTTTAITPAFTSIPPPLPPAEFTDHTLTEDQPNHLFVSISNPLNSNSTPEDEEAPNFGSSPNMVTSPNNMVTNTSTTSLSPTSSVSSSDSDDTEEEEEEEDSSPPLRARVRSPRKNHLTSELKIQRMSSAEKRKYSQYKCSTGGSSPSSSDDEIKEAFGSPSCRRNHSPPTHFAWAVHPSTATTPHFSPSSFSASFPTTSTATTFTSPPSSSSSSSPKQPVSAWNIEAARRPHRVVPPIGRHKHKFFAQMPSSFSDRPFLDFNKMQHSKRLVMVRRPMVIRNNSRVHSIQRPTPPSLQVPLDISQHSFQPVLMQT